MPKGEATPGLAVLGQEAISGAKDEAGADTWFNGQKPFAPNPLLLGPSGGNKIDGSKVVANGLNLSDGPAKPWKVAFTKAGHLHRALAPAPRREAHRRGQGQGRAGPDRQG